MNATAEFLGHETEHDGDGLSFTNEFDVFTCLQVTRLRCPSICEWSNDLCPKKSSRRTFYWERFRGCRFDRAFVGCLYIVFTYESYSLGQARLLERTLPVFLVVFGAGLVERS